MRHFNPKKSVVFISDQSILTLNIGCFGQIIITLIIIALLLSIPSLCYQNYQIKSTLKKSEKELQVTRINNASIQKKIENLEKKFTDYSSITSKDNAKFKKISTEKINNQIDPPHIFNSMQIEQIDSINKISLALNESIAQEQAKLICNSATKRILELEKFFANFGVNAAKKNTVKINCNALDNEKNIRNVLSSAFERISYLESLTYFVPIGFPMKEGRISSKFGVRMHPIHKAKRFHNGIDIVGKSKSKIFASASGKIIAAGHDSKSGNYILIDHGNGFLTKYAHLSKLKVKKGEKIEKGKIIGTIGSTGAATGIHLHYSIKNGNNYLDPEKLVTLPYV